MNNQERRASSYIRNKLHVVLSYSGRLLFCKVAVCLGRLASWWWWPWWWNTRSLALVDALRLC